MKNWLTQKAARLIVWLLRRGMGTQVRESDVHLPDGSVLHEETYQWAGCTWAYRYVK